MAIDITKDTKIIDLGNGLYKIPLNLRDDGLVLYVDYTKNTDTNVTFNYYLENDDAEGDYFAITDGATPLAKLTNKIDTDGKYAVSIQVPFSADNLIVEITGVSTADLILTAKGNNPYAV